MKEFLKHYQRLLKKFSTQQLEILLIGLGHNLDFIKHDKHTPTKEFININLDKNLVPTITKPTRITKSSATLIDNIIVGRLFQEYEANIGISDISDHLPLVLKSFQPSLYKKKALTIKTRTIDPIKCNNINSKLQEVDWIGLLQDKCANEAYIGFQTKVKSILDIEAPTKTFKIQSSRILREPWMSPGLLKCTKKQKFLYKKFLKNRNMDTYYIKYKEYRNQLTNILRRSKEEYYRTKCYEFKRDTSKLWNLINKITHKLHDKSGAIDYLKIDNIDIYDSKIISEEFAKHFSNVGTKFAKKITRSNHTFSHYLQNIPLNPSSIFMKPTNKNEIVKLIESLPNKTSRGYDEISNVLLKKLSPAISIPLEIIFNKPLEEGSFPEDMKQADVIPLFKGKESYIVNNYRPISLLVTISKILEKVVYTRTYNFLCTTNQLYQSQYGFRKGHSCENAICELVGIIAKNREEKKHTVGIFIDLSKAFDTLNHNMLLEKMSRYGIRGTTLNWFRSYLQGRSMRVKCTSNTTGSLEYSTYHQLEYGTPQGSCLGPLLFLIYINDLQHSIMYSSAILFADDTTLLQGHKNLKYLKWSME